MSRAEFVVATALRFELEGSAVGQLADAVVNHVHAVVRHAIVVADPPAHQSTAAAAALGREASGPLPHAVLDVVDRLAPVAPDAPGTGQPRLLAERRLRAMECARYVHRAVVQTTIRELPFWGQSRVRRATALFDRAYPPAPAPGTAALCCPVSFGTRRPAPDDTNPPPAKRPRKRVAFRG